MQANNPDFTNQLNLAAEKLGAKALYTTDDFFAEKENLLKPGRGIFIADKYTDNGKWMDGWESRRKRTPGHDYCIIKLGAAGKIHGVDIDTNHFLGNHPPHGSIEALCRHDDPDLNWLQSSDADWKEILPKVPLDPGSQHFHTIDSKEIWTHLKFHIYPDGGVARLKVYGEVFKDWNAVNQNESIDLASALNGGKAVCCNDMFFSHMDNLLMPGRGVNMGDGWETKRNRTPGNVDWVIIRLGHAGIIENALIATCHFKGNYPDSFSLEGCYLNGTVNWLEDAENLEWQPVVQQQKLSADAEHEFSSEILGHKPISHVRMKIYPDGGISRLRLFGKISG